MYRNLNRILVFLEALQAHCCQTKGCSRHKEKVRFRDRTAGKGTASN